MINILNWAPLAVIAITCVISYMGFNYERVMARYQFHEGAILRGKEYRRLMTSGFLHGSWWHLLFNMITLYFFKDIIVLIYGNWGFLLLYFGALLSSSVFCLWLYRHRPSYMMIGASGAVSGVVFAAIALNPQVAIYFFFIPVPIPGWLFGTLYFAYSVYRMLSPAPNDVVGHAAHLGGAAFGMAMVVISLPMILIKNGLFIGIMCLPLLYFMFELFWNKRR